MPYPAGGAQEEVRTKKVEEELATLFSRIQKHGGLLLVSTSGLVYPGAEDRSHQSERIINAVFRRTAPHHIGRPTRAPHFLEPPYEALLSCCRTS